MEQFDVFLCHNSQEKTQVEEIRTQLLQKGIYAWLDKYDFEPFRPWQDQLEEIIPQIKAAAVFIGSSGVGPWADIEMREFLVEFAQRKLRMGLVILPGCPDHLINKVPRFMRSFQWVDFRQQNPDPMERLIWGITGIKPETQTIIYPPVLERPSKLPETTPEPTTATDDLPSEKGIDYTRLRDLLAAKNWKEADKETYRVMIQAVGKEDGDWFTKNELLNFPCTDLRTINGLWVTYSDGHFGFSVQKKIYLSVGGKADGEYYKEAWEMFGDRVRWRVNSTWIDYSQLTFDTSAPKGHLPKGIKEHFSKFETGRNRGIEEGIKEIGLRLFGEMLGEGWVLFSGWGSLLSHGDL